MNVSVIVPFYNQVNWLYDAINSIDESESLSYEVIIVNDGSSEVIDVTKFIKHNERINIVNQINQGPGKARNTGIDVASGEYVAFLDSDDLFLKNKLSKQIKFMIDNNHVWSHSSYIKFYENGKEEIIDNSSFFGMIFPKCLAFSPIATPTVIVKREALENPLKRFSETMRFGQDGFMWNQLAAFYDVGVMAEPLSRVRMRGSNASLRAKNHLYVKSMMYKYMKQGAVYYKGNKIPVFLMIVFAVAAFNYKIVAALERVNMNKTFIETTSRLLYFPQYIALKVYYLWSNMKQKFQAVTHKSN
ncbi:MAG: glycosyltransferase family 2 protein [Acetobacterium sp.]|nr:glycosyltransferase family 2 protein [Acetobacterium sp.]